MDNLDVLYFDEKVSEVAKALKTFPSSYNLSKKELYDTVLSDFKNGFSKEIHPELYRTYSDNLRSGIAGVFGGDKKYEAIQHQLQANVSRFSSYKAYHATQKLRSLPQNDIETKGKIVLNAFNRWQATEYNTTIARTRTAKQWIDFNADTLSNQLYPNLRWIPSRSATPREEHIPFWGKVWSKDDPFWNENQPGNLWNCKCDWEETDEAVTDNNALQGKSVAAKELEGNPAETGEIFTDKCSYIKNSGKNRKERDRVEMTCELTNKTNTIKENLHLLSEHTTCNIAGKVEKVHFSKMGIDEYSQSLLKNKQYFWIKNEILKDIPKYISTAEYKGYKKVDLSHNTRKKTLKFKGKLDYYLYFEIILPNGLTACIQMTRVKATKEVSLYTICKNTPNDIIKGKLP